LIAIAPPYLTQNVVLRGKKSDSMFVGGSAEHEKNWKENIKGKCSLYFGECYIKHILWSYPETNKWRNAFLGEK
jgi:hypothetical protein